MNHRPLLRVLISFLLFLVAPLFAAEGELPPRTALDDYIAAADSSFSWSTVRMFQAEGATVFVLVLRSQTWRSSDEVDRTLWQHWVVVVKPDGVRHNQAFLRVGGGRNGGPPPEEVSDFLLRVATATGSVAAEVGQVPNQPLMFGGDGKPRVEDDLVAYTQARYLDTRDAVWLARMPMVKSVVRAMDAIQELLAGEEGGGVEVKRFVVSGGSKRGWTTWITGAVDSRVEAIIPVVIDTLNLRDARLHRFASYGFWAPSLRDYVHHGVLQRMHEPAMDDLMLLVDPYFYRHRLTLPKYVVNASGDEFFPPDASQFYYDELQGEKHLRYVPNSRHSLRSTDARDSILAFYRAIIENAVRPRYTWSLQDDGSFRVEVVDRPKEVLLWWATNPEARDFRVETIGNAYRSTKLKETGKGVYIGRVDAPSSGWTAFFVELSFDLGAPEPLKVTTAVHILPDVLPFADRDPTRVDEEGKPLPE